MNLSDHVGMWPRLAACLLFIAALDYSSESRGQVPADQSLASLHPAPGVQVSLWASEPMVNNPTSIDVDSQGRVWVSEALNYRMKMTQFESLKRVDGADQIKILSDTDGDGVADQVTVFADNIFPAPLGLAVEEIWRDGNRTGTRVYVGNSPDLLVLEDVDGDDRADRRYALLTGFRGVDSDHGVHGMTFGPDGKLYFTVGDCRYGADRIQAMELTMDVVDGSGRRVQSASLGTTLRVNRDGTQLDVLSSGHRNNYGAAVDAWGNLFASDNDDDGNRGCRMFWVMDGGRYGYLHPDSPRHWAEELPGIIPKLVGTGNGAPGGVVVYEGELLPEAYDGAVLQVDSGTRQVNAHPLRRYGAGFRSDYNVLLRGDDDWFRPVDLAVAPDGSVMVCDWYDAGVGGNRFSDQTTGRIYRLTGEGRSPRDTQFKGDNPIQSLGSPNVATRLAARDVLLAEGKTARSALLEVFRSGRPSDRARALHVLYSIPDTGKQDTIDALSDSDPRIRETALQLLARDVGREFVVDGQPANSPAAQFLEVLRPLTQDDDPGVRRVLLMAIRNLPTAEVGDMLKQLARSWDGRDRYYLEAIGAAVAHREGEYLQELFVDLAEDAIARGWNADPVALPPFYPIGTNDAFLRPDDQLPDANAASRIAGLAWVLQRSESLAALEAILEVNSSPSVERAVALALSEMSDPRAGELLAERYFEEGVSDATRIDIVQRLASGLTQDWESLAKSQRAQDVFADALTQPSLQADAIRAVATARISGFAQRLLDLASGEQVDQAIRAAAIEAMGRLGDLDQPVNERAETLASDLLDAAAGEPLGGPLALAALETLAALGKDRSAEVLVQTLHRDDMPLDIRRRSLQLVVSSAPGAERMIQSSRDGSFPDDLLSELSFLVRNHADRRIRQLAAEQLTPTEGDPATKIHDAADVFAIAGDANRGHDLFHNHKEAVCGRCHRVTGEGTLVGPDLASVGMKYGDRELLYHIQNPSGAINHSFAAHTFLLSDGRTIGGLIINRNSNEVKLGIATGEFVMVRNDEIEAETPQSVSLMPTGLIAGLSTQQVADLVEYLLSLRQGDAVVDQPNASLEVGH